MLDAVNVVGARVGGRPLMLSIVVLGLLFVLRHRGVPGTSNNRWTWLATRATAGAGLLGLLTYPLAAAWYASDPHFFDNAEPTMVAIGWLFHVGKPLYHLPDAAERYAHIYGPLAFMFHGAALGTFGPGIGVSKGLGVAAGLASLAFGYGAIRYHAGVQRSLVLTGVCALVLLLFRHYSFWTRPEPLQLMAASAALLFAVSARGWTGAILVGLASGILWNLKFTGPLYSLPVFVLLHRRTGWRGTSLAVGAGLAAAVAPFLAFSNVSPGNYLAWVALSARTGLLLSTLRQNLEWAAYLCLPLLLSYYAVPRQHRPQGPEWRAVLIALLLGMLGVVVAAAKPGAGSYHLLPFVPLIMYIVAWQAAGFSRAAEIDPAVPLASIAFLVTAAVVALAQQALVLTTMNERRALREIDDIEQFASTHEGVIEMGYGRTEALTLERPVLVFRNNSYLLDQPAVREHQLEGLEIPPATLDAIAHCRVRYWLIPKGEPPFSGRNPYAAVFLRPLFSDEFRRVFTATHTTVGSTAYYDVWQCQATPTL